MDNSLRSWEEIEAEHDAYIASNRYKFDKVIYRLRRIITSPLRWKRNVEHWYQRARYGYSYRDAWNGDNFISGNVAGILTYLVKHGHGVSQSYADPDKLWDTPVEIMVERRDAEYTKYAAIFSAYSNGDVWLTQEDVEKYGGVLDIEMADALEWLHKHFYELWD